MIEIKCTGSDELSIGEIKEFQGNLKRRTKDDIGKIIISIRKYGFSFPFFIWKSGKINYCLDGHCRVKALEKLLADGEELPKFPVVYIQAKDEAEAKNKLLRVNSQYGQMTIESVLEFAGEIKLDVTELMLPSGVMQFEQEETEEDLYTKKIVSPTYEPKNEKPSIKELFDEEKTQRLINEIANSDISEDEKAFLKQAAKRHTVFNYQKIADYYAHSDVKIQNLMEKSALVIIDFNKAIENGYVVLSKEIGQQYLEEKSE